VRTRSLPIVTPYTRAAAPTLSIIFKAPWKMGSIPCPTGCNVIIADGVKGTDYREIEIDGQYCKAPKIGAAIADADIIISMNHFKGHEQAGFGGALKNLGMGWAQR